MELITHEQHIETEVFMVQTSMQRRRFVEEGLNKYNIKLKITILKTYRIKHIAQISQKRGTTL